MSVCVPASKPSREGWCSRIQRGARCIHSVSPLRTKKARQQPSRLRKASWTTKVKSHGDDLEYRMDRDDLESRNRLHENQPRLQALLCRKNGYPAACDGIGSLQEWIPPNTSP